MIALATVKKYNINIDFSHLDSTSFAVEGKYSQEKITKNLVKENAELELINQIPIKIIKGYSRDHRPDLKQFILDLIVSGDGDIPLFLRVADGNENDRAVFGKIAKEYKSMIDFETMIVGDSALYTENNLKLMSGIEWLSRVPLSIKEAKNLVSELSESDLTPSSLEGYLWYEVRNNYAEIEQRWLIVESEKRKASDLEKLSKKIEIETMSMLMGLCLLVYSLGQREVRRLLEERKTGIKNQLGKLTERPTLRWIFQCFQGIHLVINRGIKQIVNLTNERKLILSFFPISCHNYYILSG